MLTKKSNIRKLSLEFSRDMYKDGAKRILLPGKILLQSVCCWPDNEKMDMKILGWFLFSNLLVTEIFHVAYVFKNFENIGDAVDAGATVTTTMEALIRLYIMLTKKNVINRILVKIWKQFWPLYAIESARRKQIERKAMVSFLLTCLFFLCSIISNSQITGAPYVRNHGLILKSLFPVEWHQLYVYEIVYTWQYYVAWYVLFVINAFDFFFIALITIYTIQLVIVQEIFKVLLTERSKRHRNVIFGERAVYMTDSRMLFECLEQHKLLIGISNDLEGSFNMAILIQFVVSTTGICAACVVLKVDSSEFLKMFMFALGHLSQLFYYCFVGQELTYQSSRLGDSIYESDWHLSYDRNFRKVLILMIQQCQKEQCLTGAGIAKLDFASFVKILRLSFSFYTLLNNLLMEKANQ